MKTRVIAAGLVVASLFIGPSAFAQDVATAEALFNKGIADLEAGKFDSACPAIGESYRLDPRPGTLFTLAECYAKAGKTASAVARYQDYIELFSRLPPDQQAKQHGRDQTAAAQKAALAPDVPMLTLSLAPDSPPGTVVRRDDVVLGGPSLGLPLPVDPGDHVLSAQPPNGPATTQKVTLAKGEKKTIVLTLKPEGGAVGPTSSTSSSSSSTPSGSQGQGSGQRTAGFVIGGVGVVGILVGAITGGLTLAKKSDISNECNTGAKTCTGNTGLNDVSSAQTTGLVSTIGFIVGVAGLGGGAALVLTAPKKSDTAVTSPTVRMGVLNAGPAGASFGFSGAF